MNIGRMMMLPLLMTSYLSCAAGLVNKFVFLIKKMNCILFCVDGLTNHLKEIQYNHENNTREAGNTASGLPANAQKADGKNW
jgi:hypothetical protein